MLDGEEHGVCACVSGNQPWQMPVHPLLLEREKSFFCVSIEKLSDMISSKGVK